MSNIRASLAKYPALKATYHAIRNAILQTIGRVSPSWLAHVRYRLAWNRGLNLKTPRLFDEKLLWLNLYWRHPLKATCGDKFTMRAYVESQGLGDLLPKLHGVFERAEDIDFAALPHEYVLKCTHGCKCNVFCPDKEALNEHAARRDLSRWMRIDYSRLCGELHYKTMKPRIICEEFLRDGTGTLPTDFKVYCFGGVPHCVLCCTGRIPNGKADFGFVDLNWKFLPYYRDQQPEALTLPMPATLPEILRHSATLAAPFPFVRMDFYSIEGRVVLGEMTFTPDACVDPTYSDIAQQNMGNLLRLPTRLLAPPDHHAHLISQVLDEAIADYSSQRPVGFRSWPRNPF